MKQFQTITFILIFLSAKSLFAEWSMFPRYGTPSANRDFIRSDITQGSTPVGVEYAENFTDVITTGARYLEITWWGGRANNPNDPFFVKPGDTFELRIYRDGVGANSNLPPGINQGGGPANRQELKVRAVRQGALIGGGGTPDVNQFTATTHSFNPNTYERVYEYNIHLDLEYFTYQDFEIDQNWSDGMWWMSIVETDSSTNPNDPYNAWNWTLGGGEYLEYSASRSAQGWRDDTAYTIHNYGITRDSRAFSITTVPEPSSLVFLGITGCGFISWRRKKDSKDIA